MILALTGHRPDKLAVRPGWKAAVRSVLVDYLTTHKPAGVISGMALGFDTIGAEVALALGIPVHAAIPFNGQDMKWSHLERVRYAELLERCTSRTVVYPGGYHASKMTGRNVWMVDRADRMCALWDGSSGGTGHCVRYANKVGRPLDNLWSAYVG